MNDPIFKFSRNNFNIVRRSGAGFTIIELMVTMGILLVLYTLATITISNLPSKTAQTSSIDLLVSDIRSQQTKAMSTASAYGIHFDTGNTSYTLFKGTTYTSGTEKFVVNLDPNLVFTNDLFSGSQIIFTERSGDVSGYLAGADSVNIKNNQTGEGKTLRINKYGATY